MFRETLREIMTSGIVRPRRPASAAEIANAEKQLDVHFPAIYKQLLRSCGVLRVYDRAVYGLGPDTVKPADEVLSVVFETLYARQTLGLPAHLVVLWDSSHEDNECLDTSGIRGGDCPIVYFDRPIAESRSRRPRVIAPNLETWLRQVVKRQLKVKELYDRELPGMHDEMGDMIPRRRRRTAKRAASRTKSRGARRRTNARTRRSKS